MISNMFGVSFVGYTSCLCLAAVQVVLPLLQNEVVATGWVSQADFLTGLALVQAMPGPLFNFAAYLGAPP